jgi:hypothetical protein
MTTTNRPRVGGNAAIDEVSCSTCKTAASPRLALFGFAIFLSAVEEILVLDR